jgi:hypothetical protein
MPTQPAVRWVSGVPFPGVKYGRDVTLTTHPQSSAEVKNEKVTPQPRFPEKGLPVSSG